MAINVLVPGPLTTVQDLGRYGYQHCGMHCCGAMDQDSCKRANDLVGNSPAEAVLEHTLFGGTCQFDQSTVIALTGADMNPILNGQLCPMNRAISVSPGSVLTLGMAVSGCRTYLAVAGGIQVPPVLGSRSTDLKCGIGGYQGRSLRSGDRLMIPEYVPDCIPPVSHEAPARPVYPSYVTVRVIEGPQAEYFTGKGLDTFYSVPYTVSEQSDRMGCRMEGPAIESFHGTDIISDGIVFGSIQVTSAGQPIVLMADRQTTGGYAKIATVFSRDLPILAQCRPGNTVHFRKISLEEVYS